MDQEPVQQTQKKTIEIKIKPTSSKSQERIGSFISILINSFVFFWGSLFKIAFKLLFSLFGCISRIIGRFIHIKLTEWGEAWFMFFRLPAVLLMWSIVAILCVFALMAGTHYGSDRAWTDIREARYEQY